MFSPRSIEGVKTGSTLPSVLKTDVGKASNGRIRGFSLGYFELPLAENNPGVAQNNPEVAQTNPARTGPSWVE